jgi:hypothetical protein
MKTISSFAIARRVSRMLTTLAAASIVSALVSGAGAQQLFKSPEEASAALVSAAKAGDQKAMVKVLGRGGADIASSGDPVADAATRQRFVSTYDAKHRIAPEGDDKAVLVIGDEDFPFPIPLIRRDGAWQFDTAAGRLEILYRRIGRNELDAIQACLAYVDAQNEYAEKDRTGSGVGTYAQRIVSRPGKKDGLYWPAAQGDDASPLGELFAQATGEGYRVGKSRVGRSRAPFHGYYFKILTRQGASAPGGTLDYVAGGRMIGGFALVAFPAEYGNSGVMTFLVNHTGTVLEKDLGPRTGEIAERMTAYDPDQTWRRIAVSASGP